MAYDVGNPGPGLRQAQKTLPSWWLDLQQQYYFIIHVYIFLSSDLCLAKTFLTSPELLHVKW